MAKRGRRGISPGWSRRVRSGKKRSEAAGNFDDVRSGEVGEVDRDIDVDRIARKKMKKHYSNLTGTANWDCSSSSCSFPTDGGISVK